MDVESQEIGADLEKKKSWPPVFFFGCILHFKNTQIHVCNNVCMYIADIRVSGMVTHLLHIYTYTVILINKRFMTYDYKRWYKHGVTAAQSQGQQSSKPLPGEGC